MLTLGAACPRLGVRAPVWGYVPPMWGYVPQFGVRAPVWWHVPLPFMTARPRSRAQSDDRATAETAVNDRRNPSSQGYPDLWRSPFSRRNLERKSGSGKECSKQSQLQAKPLAPLFLAQDSVQHPSLKIPRALICVKFQFESSKYGSLASMLT